ncbi:MAG: hypothetical protein ING19_17335 [Azospirillum sp.]|nr:hypothetical protein [Azospirillum sp.]
MHFFLPFDDAAFLDSFPVSFGKFENITGRRVISQDSSRNSERIEIVFVATGTQQSQQTIGGAGDGGLSLFPTRDRLRRGADEFSKLGLRVSDMRTQKAEFLGRQRRFRIDDGARDCDQKLVDRNSLGVDTIDRADAPITAHEIDVRQSGSFEAEHGTDPGSGRSVNYQYDSLAKMARNFESAGLRPPREWEGVEKSYEKRYSWFATFAFRRIAMAQWTIVGIHADRLGDIPAEKFFVRTLEADDVRSAEKAFLATASRQDRPRQAHIAAIVPGVHADAIHAGAMHADVSGAADAVLKGRRGGWTVIGLDRATGERFVRYSRFASLETAIRSCETDRRKNPLILAGFPGRLEAADEDRKPILEPKLDIWTVCGIWDLDDSNDLFADSIDAESAKQAEAKIRFRRPGLTVCGVFEGVHDAHDAGRMVRLKTPIQWTVAGVYAESGERYAETVEADSWMSARAICELTDDDLIVAGVFKGALEAADAAPTPSQALAMRISAEVAGVERAIREDADASAKSSVSERATASFRS